MEKLYGMKNIRTYLKREEEKEKRKWFEYNEEKDTKRN
jgi:hypothetical protein